MGNTDAESQMNGALLERVALNPATVSPAFRRTRPDALEVLQERYVIDSLALPDGHSESNLHKGLLENLKQFLLELSRDFVRSVIEYPVQDGKQDVAIDLPFFHRGLNALVSP